MTLYHIMFVNVAKIRLKQWRRNPISHGILTTILVSNSSHPWPDLSEASWSEPGV